MLTVLFIGTAFLFNGIVFPFFRYRDEFSASVRREEDRYRQNLAATARARQWQERYSPLLERFRRTQTNEEIISAMVAEVESAARAAGLKVADMQPQKVRSESFVYRFVLNLGVDGPFPDVMAFIHRLQNEPHVFQVKAMRIQKQMSKEGEVSCQLTLNRTLINPEEQRP